MEKKIEIWNKSEEIKKMYELGMPSTKISKKLNVGKQLILQILRKSGIKTNRPISFYKSNKSFEELYGEEKAKIIKSKLSSVHKGVPKSEDHKRKERDGSTLLLEARKKIVDYYKTHLSPSWIDGRSFEPYPITFNNQFKEEIRNRDNFTCLKCGLFESDCKKLYKQKLHIHHIDYNKKLTIKENCCCLCLRCNTEVNQNRVHWIKFFQSLLTERYGYKYDENQNIILNIGGNLNEK